MSRKNRLSIADAGSLGRDILNDIVTNTTELVAVSGKITIEVDLSIEDRNLFKDDLERHSKLVVHVDLKKINFDE